jgi:hypothetical protein
MDSKKFRLRYVLSGFAFIFGTFFIAWIVGDSYVLAVLIIIGWLVFVGAFLGYVENNEAKRRNDPC